MNKLLLLFLTILFVGCSSDGEDYYDSKFSAEALIGSWNVVDYTMPSTDFTEDSEDEETQYETITYESGSYTFTFNEYAKVNIFYKDGGKTSTNEFPFSTYLKTITIKYTEDFSITWDVESFDGTMMKLHRYDWVLLSDEENARKIWCHWYMTLKRKY